MCASPSTWAKTFSDDLIFLHPFGLFLVPELNLHEAVLQVPLSDGNPDGNTDKVAILEFYSRPLIAVIQYGVDAFSEESPCTPLSAQRPCVSG